MMESSVSTNAATVNLKEDKKSCPKFSQLSSTQLRVWQQVTFGCENIALQSCVLGGIEECVGSA